MCWKSNPIVVFVFDLMSTYEGEHWYFFNYRIKYFKIILNY
jgi:hypothetical protein